MIMNIIIHYPKTNGNIGGNHYSHDLPIISNSTLPSPQTGTEPQRWNPGTLEPWNLLLGCKAGLIDA